ncbi:winged helix-turn-helix domain-containing protein [Methanolobus profundi]|uniref:Regulatory protein, arsR family n=1 Tax=Methanolobus profundi TaxID=487685 RepID=A0A1I4U8C3_9EURY|nr:winged helix-turn-helix domain-containing protein [Methanolobus profundi]SFM85165.1 regulatory protein, arsR family [Methanolobus profundi]
MSEEDMRKKHEWMSKLEKEGRLKANPTEDHAIGLRTMQNPIRRKILKLLYGGSLSLEEIGEEISLNSSLVKFHVEMLENALYVDRIENSEPLAYQISPRGEGYLVNVEEAK